jgi:hypothetical protein
MHIFSHRLFPKRSAAAASLLLMVSCGFPGMSVDNGGLGNTQIAQLLARTWMNSPEWISGQVADMLKAKGGTGPAVAQAQSIGFECGTTLTSCRYGGQLNYHLLNVPAENAAHANAQVSIAIEITSENPLVIHTNKNTKDQ